MNHPLQEALAAIEGVASAEVELSDEGPLAVRVRLAPGAHEPLVAASVQRILEEHGLRSRVAPARRPTRPTGPPLPPAMSTERPANPPSPPGWMVEEGPVAFAADEEGAEPPVESGDTATGIAGVVVELSPDGATIRVSNREGRTVVRRARPSSRAVDEAVVSAVGELVAPELAEPGLVTVEEGTAYVTVVVEAADASIKVGSALLGPGRALAVAQAVWVALGGNRGT